MKPLIRAEICTAALRANLARVRELAPASRVLAVVKANAYGHGLVLAAEALGDADALGVARLEEALLLRGAGVTRPILLMEGVFDAEGLAEAGRHRLDLVVHCEDQIALLEDAPAEVQYVVWLKIDTGMNRLGIGAGQLPGCVARIKALGHRVPELRLMTHLALAEEPGNPLTVAQVEQFTNLTCGLDYARSMANSAAVFDLPATHAEWVRPGLVLYGASPFPDRLGADLGLVPAMRLVSTVIAVRNVPLGQTVGYGGAWRAGRDTRVAVVAAGYADGLFRSTDPDTPVLIRGQRARPAGRISMDMMALDVSDIPSVQAGDEAVLFGPELPVEEVAAHAGTIAYELLCAVSQRVPRVTV